MTQTSCELFHDDLAAVLDGDEPTIDRHVDHLADCDGCRDLRHEAGSIASLVGDAGADYKHPDNLVETLMAAIDEAAETASVPTVSSAREATATTTDAPAPAPDAAPAPGRTVTPLRSRKWIPAIAAVGALAAAAGIAAYVAQSGGTDSPEIRGVTATIAEIQAAGEELDGVTVKLAGADSFVPMTIDGRLTEGAIIRTSSRTRARIVLSDGSELTLNQGTELELATDKPRGVQLHTGELVADIAHLDDGPNAILATPNATVEVLGTRFLLAAVGDYTSVRVSRGLVALSSDAGRTEVRPGEEGVVASTGAPEVAPSGQLASAMAFAEIAAKGTDDGAMAGIGELRAFKPGEKRDRDWKLSVSKQKVTVRIAGNIARTEIEQTFKNDSKTTLEGVYKFPLPSDSRIESLALDVKDGFEQGAFVDKERAAKIWRGVIRKATARKKRPQENDVIWVPGPWRDPALLEWQRGGRFELRIFPIPGNGSRTIKLAYTQVLEPQGAARRYVYPLAYAKDGSTAVEDFSVDVRVNGADPVRTPRVLGYDAEPTIEGRTASMRFAASKFQPRGNFIVEYTPMNNSSELSAWTFSGAAAAGPGKNSNSRRGGLDPNVAKEQARIAADKRATALFALRPKLPRWTESRSRDFIFVLDSSQSMFGERFTRARKLLSAAVGEMDRRDRVSVIACDVECQVHGDASEPPSSTTARSIDDFLAAIEPAGASNVGGALERASQLATERRRQGADSWVVVLGDGVASMGFRSAAGLERKSRALAEKHGVSFTTIGIGSDADDAVLGAVARAGGGHFLPWRPGQATGAAALALLETTYGVSLENPEVTFPQGLTDLAPTELPTIRAGQEVLVGARFDGAVSGDVILRGTIGGKKYEQRFPIELTASDAQGNAFVPRMWAALDIARREHEATSSDRATIVAMSKAYGVLSRHTSLLVLESDAMFRAFGVDRSAPQVTWTGDEEGLAMSTAGTIGYTGMVGRSSRLAAATRRKGVLDSKSSKKSKKGKADFDDEDESMMPMGGADGSTADKASTGAAAAEKAPAPAARPRDVRQAPNLANRSRRRPGSWMRRVWYSTGSIAAFTGASSRTIKAVADAEAAHAADPDSRERHRALVQRLSHAGQIERATEVATKWLERDRFDTEALVYVADMLARSGQRDKGLRLLSGIVDIAPENAAFHERMATAYDHADKKAAACAHRIAAAEVDLDDASRLASAIRCQTTAGQRDNASWMTSRATEKVRERAEKAAAKPESTRKRRRQLSIEASWLGASDLDISVVTSSGQRISWMGGRRGITGENAMVAGRENLALRRLRTGSYIIEVSRSDASDATPIEGSLDVVVLGKKRTLSFKLGADQKRAAVSRIAVRRQSRMVPM